MKHYEIRQFNLPPYAFLEDNSELRGRNVIVHVRSMSAVEMFKADSINLNPNVKHKNFEYNNIYGDVEYMVCVLHFAPFLDDDEDIETMMQGAIQYYCSECDQMDRTNPDNLMN